MFLAVLVVATGVTTLGCGRCSTPTGPTAPAAAYSARLAPGEFRYYDTDTPTNTAQVKLQLSLDSVSAPLRIRIIESTCVPDNEQTCKILYEQNLDARPAGVYSFGSGVPVLAMRTRLLLQNASTEETVNITLGIAPQTAGCNY
jgi:hypothetical protein